MIDHRIQAQQEELKWLLMDIEYLRKKYNQTKARFQPNELNLWVVAQGSMITIRSICWELDIDEKTLYRWKMGQVPDDFLKLMGANYSLRGLRDKLINILGPDEMLQSTRPHEKSGIMPD